VKSKPAINIRWSTGIKQAPRINGSIKCFLGTTRTIRAKSIVISVVISFIVTEKEPTEKEI